MENKPQIALGYPASSLAAEKVDAGGEGRELTDSLHGVFEDLSMLAARESAAEAGKFSFSLATATDWNSGHIRS
jgi:hypothetical protein